MPVALQNQRRTALAFSALALLSLLMTSSFALAPSQGDFFRSAPSQDALKIQEAALCPSTIAPAPCEFLVAGAYHVVRRRHDVAQRAASERCYYLPSQPGADENGEGGTSPGSYSAEEALLYADELWLAGKQAQAVAAYHGLVDAYPAAEEGAVAATALEEFRMLTLEGHLSGKAIQAFAEALPPVESCQSAVAMRELARSQRYAALGLKNSDKQMEASRLFYAAMQTARYAMQKHRNDLHQLLIVREYLDAASALTKTGVLAWEEVAEELQRSIFSKEKADLTRIAERFALYRINHHHSNNQGEAALELQNLLEDSKLCGFSGSPSLAESEDALYAEWAMCNGEAHFQLHDFTQALTIFQSVLDDYSGIEPIKNRAAYYAGLTEYFMAHFDPEVGVSVFSRALDTYPEGPLTPAALYMLARSHLELDEDDQALGRYEAILAYFPDSRYAPIALEVIQTQGWNSTYAQIDAKTLGNNDLDATVEDAQTTTESVGCYENGAAVIYFSDGSFCSEYGTCGETKQGLPRSVFDSFQPPKSPNEFQDLLRGEANGGTVLAGSQLPHAPSTTKPNQATKMACLAPGINATVLLTQLTQVFHETDISIPVRGGLKLGFSRRWANQWGFQRAYYSRKKYLYTAPTDVMHQTVGRNWCHNYSTQLRVSTKEGRIVFFSPHGNVYVLKQQEDESLYRMGAEDTSDFGRHIYLKKNPDSGGYSFFFDNGMEYQYSPIISPEKYRFCRLEKICDGAGNTITLEYERFREGRTIEDAALHERLVKITPPGYGDAGGDDRYLKLDYNEENKLRLDSVRLMKDAVGAEEELYKVAYSYFEDNGTKYNSQYLTGVCVNDHRIEESSGAVRSVGVGYDYELKEVEVDDDDVDVFYISKVTDRMGNEIRFSYDAYRQDPVVANELSIYYPNGLRSTFSHQEAFNLYSTNVVNWQDGEPLSHYRTHASNDAANSRPRYYCFYNDPTMAEEYDTFLYHYSDGKSSGWITYTQSSWPDYITLNKINYNSNERVESFGISQDRFVRYDYETPQEKYPISITYPEGETLTLSYDNQNRLVKLNHPSLTGGVPPGSEEGILWTYDAYSQLTTYRDQGGGEWHFEYTPRGDLSRRIFPGDSLENPQNQIEYFYDDFGALIELHEYHEGVLADIWTYEYSTEGKDLPELGIGVAGWQLTKVTHCAGANKGAKNPSIRYGYDLNGNRIVETGPEGLTRRLEYDTMNQLITIVEEGDPADEEDDYILRRQYNPLGLIEEESDSSGYTVNYAYDHMGRIILVEDAIGEKHYSYDERGNLIKVKDENGNESRYEYEEDNALALEEDPCGRLIEYQYDTLGRLTKRSAKANGNDFEPINYEYYNNPQKLSTIYPRPQTNDAGDIIAYGKDTKALTFDHFGRVTEITDWMMPHDGIGHSFHYNQDGLICEYRDYDYSPAAQNAVKYEYDRLGRCLRASDFDGESTHYRYNKAGFVEAIDSPGSRYWDFTYNAFGQKTGMQIANGIRAEYDYDGRHRLNAIRYSDADATPLMGWDYRFDGKGRMLSEKNACPGNYASWTYHYDLRGRLEYALRCDAAGQVDSMYAYRYDGVDNLLERQVLRPGAVLLRDDFEDTDLTKEPVWEGVGAVWRVLSGALQYAPSSQKSLPEECRSLVAHDDVILSFQYKLASKESAPIISFRADEQGRNGLWLYLSRNELQVNARIEGDSYALGERTELISEVGSWYTLQLILSGAHLAIWRSSQNQAPELIREEEACPVLSGNYLSFSCYQGLRPYLGNSVYYDSIALRTLTLPEHPVHEEFEQGSGLFDAADDAWDFSQRHALSLQADARLEMGTSLLSGGLYFSYCAEENGVFCVVPRTQDSNNYIVISLRESSIIAEEVRDGVRTFLASQAVDIETIPGAWYDCYLRLAQDHIEMWRGPQGIPLVKVVDIAHFTTWQNTKIQFGPGAQGSYRLDSVRLYPERAPAWSYANTFSDGEAAWGSSPDWFVKDGVLKNNAAVSQPHHIWRTNPAPNGIYRFSYCRVTGSELKFYARIKDSWNQLRFSLGENSISLNESYQGEETLLQRAQLSSTANQWYDLSVMLDGSHAELWRKERGAENWTRLLAVENIRVLDNTHTGFEGLPGAAFQIDDLSFTTKEISLSEYRYTKANDLVTQTQNGIEIRFEHDAYARRTSKWQVGQDYYASYFYRFGDKLKKYTSNFPGESYVSFMYDGLGRRRFKHCNFDTQPDAEKVWYRYDPFGRKISSYGDSPTDFWSIGDHRCAYVHKGAQPLAEVQELSITPDASRYYLDDYMGSVRAVYDGAQQARGLVEYAPKGENRTAMGDSANHYFKGLEWDGEAGLYYGAGDYYSPEIGRALSKGEGVGPQKPRLKGAETLLQQDLAQRLSNALEGRGHWKLGKQP